MNPTIAPIVMIVMGLGCLYYGLRETDAFMRKALFVGAGFNAFALSMALTYGF